MKLNAGIITSKLQETRDFYVNKLGFGVSFENDWYLLLHTPNRKFEISFLLPHLDSQAKIFKAAFENKGVYFTIEVEDVDRFYSKLKANGMPIEVEIKNEPWGDRHFTIVDPNGIAIDYVHYQAPENKES